MRARLALAGVAFLAAAAGAGAVLRRPPPGTPAPHANPFHLGGFDSLAVEKNGARTTLRKRADGFWVVAPITYAADPSAATAAFAALEKLDPGAIVTRRPQRYAELEVDVEGEGDNGEGDGKPRGLGVTVFADAAAGHGASGGAAILSLVIGKTVDGGTMVRVRGGAGADAVWQVNGDLRAILDKGTSDWRDRSVTTFPAGEAREIAIDVDDDAHIVVRKTDAGDAGTPGWRVVQSSEEIAAIDDQVPREIVATLAALKASDFADGVTPAAAGLAPPRLTVAVTLQGGEKDLLLIGGDAGADAVFVKTPDNAQIFHVARFDIERIAHRPIQFRRKVLCDLPEADVDTISITRAADSFTLVRDARGWRASAPRGLNVDPDKVAAFPTIFRGWRAPRIAEDARDRAAFTAPTVTITGRTRSARCAIAAVPHPRQPDAYLARALPGPEIYVVPGWMIDRVAVKLDTIRAR
ncbi:MAG TPA: DUF4340 domain-containing protein [Polyangia bacterium]|nr:DUF4340 domain-containing protein [Polyangia bacterium]